MNQRGCSLLRNITSLCTRATLVFTCLLAFSEGNAFAATYYVSLAGNDGNDGRTLHTSFRTLGKAGAVAQAGDTVYLRGGTYTGYVQLRNSGSSNARITFESYQGETAVIDGSNLATDPPNIWNQPAVIRVVGHYITLRRLEVKNAAADAIFVTGTNAVLDTLHVHDTYMNPIRFWETYDGLVVNSLLHDTDDAVNGGGDADCLSVSGNSSTFGRHTIQNNIAYNCADDGIDMWKSSGNIVEGNIVYRAGFNVRNEPAGNGNGFKLGGQNNAANNIVRNNIAYDNKENGFDTNSGCGNQIYNNTAFRN